MVQRLLGGLEGLTENPCLLRLQDRHEPLPYPLGYWRSDRVPNGVVPQAIDSVGLPLVERKHW